ncbi:hypothetical protein L1987_06221 [Smallanthus sonchifolius]|uniref:Uncharacterized protein n=1 Tax=Smallanthus sonchifolius TaxID=185202 RepID=A0ACB9JXQ4_9ASTR|nr:hypothetical protein L1987_06221 [Smallanthus sonchifolius]
MERGFQSLLLTGKYGVVDCDFPITTSGEAYNNREMSYQTRSYEKSVLSSLNYPYDSSYDVPDGNIQSSKEYNKSRCFEMEEKLKRLKTEPSTELFNFIPTTVFNQLPELRSVELVNLEDRRLKQKFSPIETTANPTLTNFQLTANYFIPAPVQQLQPLRPPLPPPAKLSIREQAYRRRHTLSDKTRSLQKLLPVDRKMDMSTIFEETHKSDHSVPVEVIYFDFVTQMNCKEKLEDKVMAMLIDYENGGSSSLQLLELIDDIERMGLGYRFQTNITRVLSKLASINETEEEEEEDNLHVVSLKFRLLRQHGYSVSQDVLKRFKNTNDGLIECLHADVKVALSLYEASYLALEGELDLHEIKLFATKHLMNLNVANENGLINHALDVPLYHRMHRLQARWYIDAYGKLKDANQVLLELAILDFNMVQSAYHRDLQKASK